MGEFIYTVTPPAKLLTSDYLAEGRFPVIDQSQSYICGWTNNDDAIIEDGLPLIVFGDHTCILKLIDQPFAQGADGIKVFKPNNSVQTEFFYQSLQFKPLVMEQYKRHFSILRERKVAYPDRKTGEQQKIADCLTSVDELITAQTQKLDALKTHKKGLMQQLFPADGETVPILRFPEFQEAGEWEVTALGNVAKFSSGGTPSKEIAEYWSGEIPWISAASMYNILIDNSDLNITEKAVKDGARIAKKETILILVRGSMLYKRIPIGITVRDVAFNQDVKALTLLSDIVHYFLLYQLIAVEPQLLKKVSATGIGAGKIDTEELQTLSICIPIKEEQQKIADCLSSVDDLITAQAQKVEALKSHKKGLMQQLFPAVDEVSA